MSKKRITAGAVVRGTDKGYNHGAPVLKPGSERPVEKFDQKYPFMPNRYVFPGGRVDRADARVPIATPLDRHVKARLERAATSQRAQALGVAAVRETFEETGLMLAKPL